MVANSARKQIAIMELISLIYFESRDDTQSNEQPRDKVLKGIDCFTNCSSSLQVLRVTFLLDLFIISYHHISLFTLGFLE